MLIMVVAGIASGGSYIGSSGNDTLQNIYLESLDDKLDIEIESRKAWTNELNVELFREVDKLTYNINSMIGAEDRSLRNQEMLDEFDKRLRSLEKKSP